MNLKQKAIALALSSMVTDAFPLSALGEQFKVEEGTPIRLKLTESVSSSRNRPGDTINFQVADDVLAEDGSTVVIKAGALAWGTVAELEKRGMIGKKGELSITVDGTKAVDGKKVPLRANVSREGQSKLGTSVVMAALVPGGLLWLLMKGKDAVLPAGTQISAYIDRNVVVNTVPTQVQDQTSAAVSIDSTQAQPAKAVPDYLKKYAEKDESASDALKALDQLKQQGLLTAEEYEAKKKVLTKR